MAIPIRRELCSPYPYEIASTKNSDKPRAPRSELDLYMPAIGDSFED